MTKVRLVVLGAMGRMGRAILDAIANDSSFHLKGAVVRESANKSSKTSKGEGLKKLGNVALETSVERVATKRDVVVDVTQPTSVIRNVNWAAKAGTPYVLAVTGLSEKAEAAVAKAAKKIPIVVAPNLSMGVAVLSEVAWIAAALLPDCEIEIVESHHRDKKDAPSGTALSLAQLMMDVSNRKGTIQLGRPAKGKTKSDSVTIHSLRGGDVVGEHRIYLTMNGERIELSHVANSRAIFARGALKAARFVYGQKPGIYTMHDVMGLGEEKSA